MTQTSNKTSISSDTDAITSEIHIAAPPQRVFQALTDSAELLRWFTDPGCPVRTWEMEARVGGRYRYKTEKGTVVVNGVSEFECHGEIIEFVPPRLLAYTWTANWHEDKSRPTEVRWKLTADAVGTWVKVTHSALTQEDVARKDYAGGWPGVLEMLRKFTEK
jgi:uncharacterized protein YndB with AHSA1/START domain